MKQNDIYWYLRQQMIDFTLAPGEMLSENLLSQQLNTSRSPIRDALSRLEEEGWVTVYPQRGTQVSFLSIQKIKDYCFVKKNLDFSVFQNLCSQAISTEMWGFVHAYLSLQREHLKEQNYRLVISDFLEMYAQLYRMANHTWAWSLLNRFGASVSRIYFLQMQSFGIYVRMSAVDSWENTIINHQLLLESLQYKDVSYAYMFNFRNTEQILRSGESFSQLYPHYYCNS